MDKTGKKIKELGEVSAPADRCPFMTALSQDGPKVIAKPDRDTIDAMLAEFAS